MFLSLYCLFAIYKVKMWAILQNDKKVKIYVSIEQQAHYQREIGENISWMRDMNS